MVKTQIGRAARWKAGKPHQVALILGSLVWILLGGAAHFLTGPRYEFHLVFLVPVVAVCWYAGLKAGVLTTLISAMVWLIADWRHAAALHVLVINEAVRLSVFLLIVVLLDRLRGALEREFALARLDPLTRLSNRRDFEERGAAEIARARRYERPLTLISLDLDNFKEVNDREGHEVGDLVLKAVAATLDENVRAMDVVARVGGDEFAILLPEAGREAGAEITAKLQQKLNLAMKAKGWDVTASFGVVTFATPPEFIDELVKDADTLMYEAKHAGKNRIRQDVVRN